MILELSLEEAETIPQLGAIALNSDFPTKLAGQRLYECFLPARLDFQAPTERFEIERNALVVIVSKNSSRIAYPFDACRFQAGALAEFGGILASYNFRSYAFLDERHVNVFSNDTGRKIGYTEAADFNAYLELCRNKDTIYPIFTSFDKRKGL